MTRLLYFGRGGRILDSLLTGGCTQVDSAENADVVLVETYDNEALDPVQRLTGTITLVREALDEIEHLSTPQMIVVTDHSSINGHQRNGTSTGAAIDGIHGFGSLTAEVLSRRAASSGILTKVFRIHPSSTEEAISEIKSTMVKTNHSDDYQVFTLGA